MRLILILIFVVLHAFGFSQDTSHLKKPAKIDSVAKKGKDSITVYPSSYKLELDDQQFTDMIMLLTKEIQRLTAQRDLYVEQAKRQVSKKPK